MIVERVADAELQRIDAEANSEIVIELFLRDGHLGHTETAKRAGGDDVGMNGTRERSIVRNDVRPGSVNGYSSRDRWSPRGICAGVEVGGEVER